MDMINFDNLPKEKPEGTGDFPLPRIGFHLATITKAEYKVSENNNEMYALTLKLDEGGLVWDNVMLIDKPTPQYKLARLIQACKLPLVGNIDKKDLVKMLPNKRIVVDITTEENTWRGVTKEKPKVEAFKNDIFYPPEEAAALVPQEEQADTAPEAPNSNEY